MAVKIKKDTLIQVRLAPWMARKLGKGPVIRGSFEQMAKIVGAEFDPPRPSPFDNMTPDGQHDSDYRIRIKGHTNHLLVVVELVDDDGEIIHFVFPVALRYYWEKHFKGATK